MAESAKRSHGSRGLLILLGITLLGFVALVVGAYVVFNRSDSVEEGSTLEITLDGGYTDGPVVNPLAELGLGGGNTNSLWDLRAALRRAATDDAINGVLLTIRSPQMGFAQRQELVAELERFREVGKKPVHALIVTDMVTDGTYYLASGASKIWVSPGAWWVVNGLQADIEFYRGTLDKLKIEPDVIMFKEYKSAGETFLNTEMSEAMREATTTLLQDVFDLWLDDVAARRSMDRSALVDAVNLGTMPGARAVEVGLADELGYRDQVVDAIELEAGVEEFNGITVGKYMGKNRRPDVSGDRIAVVFGDGPIVSAAGDDGPFSMGGGTLFGPTVAKHIRKAAEHDDVKAIVFRINSPGGAIVGSDLIWREIERAQEAGKPVVVSMGSVAASGGYWVSMGADAIVANSGTITGSIGVVFTKFNIDGFYEMLGANVDSITLGENAGVFSAFEGLDEAQRENVTALMESSYTQFVSKVAEGRGSTFDEIEPLAHGRVWSGTAALKNGLIDEIGGIDRAIALAAEKAELVADDPTVQVFPPKKEFFEQLIEDLQGVETPADFDLEAFVREIGAPRIQALAPSIHIH